MGSLWAGVDVGKTHHHVCVVDDDGTGVLSEKIPNDQHAADRARWCRSVRHPR